MKLSCIGCGPGDPDLLTVKAVDRIRNADAIFTPTSKEGKPSIALSIARKYIDNHLLQYKPNISNDKDKDSSGYNGKLIPE
jgi:precorrin-2 methylase